MSDETAAYRAETTENDGTLALPRDPIAPPQISGYTIRGKLGEGGMGAVFLAHDDVLGRSVAIKVISPAGHDALAEARFLREARTMATAEHPNIVRVLAFGTADAKPYLIMELVDGESLAKRLMRVKRLGVHDALRTIRPVVEALAAAWQKGIVHRDIKPSNILIDSKGNVRVADFGLAKPADLPQGEELTASGLMVGSPYYVAPEQAAGLPTDFRADIYSLGIVLFEMLTGKRPFTGSNAVSIVAKHLHAPLPKPDAPPVVAALLERMTAKDPQKRYASYGLLLRDIDRIIAEGTSTLPASTAFAAPRRAASWPVWTAVAIVAIAIAALALLHRKPAPVPVATPVPAKTTTTSDTTVTVTAAPEAPMPVTTVTYVVSTQPQQQQQPAPITLTAQPQPEPPQEFAPHREPPPPPPPPPGYGGGPPPPRRPPF
jgi:eukaryotic-like serine/threonine-protein kinase